MQLSGVDWFACPWGCTVLCSLLCAALHVAFHSVQVVCRLQALSAHAWRPALATSWFAGWFVVTRLMTSSETLLVTSQNL